MSNHTVKLDSLINEMIEITNQHELVEIKMVCQFSPTLIKQETGRKCIIIVILQEVKFFKRFF